MDKVIKVSGWQEWFLKNLLTSRVRAAFVALGMAVVAAATEAAIGWLQAISEVPPV